MIVYSGHKMSLPNASAVLAIHKCSCRSQNHSGPYPMTMTVSHSQRTRSAILDVDDDDDDDDDKICISSLQDCALCGNLAATIGKHQYNAHVVGCWLRSARRWPTFMSSNISRSFDLVSACGRFAAELPNSDGALFFKGILLIQCYPEQQFQAILPRFSTCLSYCDMQSSFGSISSFSTSSSFSLSSSSPSTSTHSCTTPSSKCHIVHFSTSAIFIVHIMFKTTTPLTISASCLTAYGYFLTPDCLQLMTKNVNNSFDFLSLRLGHKNDFFSIINRHLTVANSLIFDNYPPGAAIKYQPRQADYKNDDSCKPDDSDRLETIDTTCPTVIKSAPNSQFYVGRYKLRDCRHQAGFRDRGLAWGRIPGLHGLCGGSDTLLTENAWGQTPCQNGTRLGVWGSANASVTASNSQLPPSVWSLGSVNRDINRTPPTSTTCDSGYQTRALPKNESSRSAFCLPANDGAAEKLTFSPSAHNLNGENSGTGTSSGGTHQLSDSSEAGSGRNLPETANGDLLVSGPTSREMSPGGHLDGSSGSQPAGTCNGSQSNAKQLEELNMVKNSLFSQDGWGGSNVKQDTSWDVEGTTPILAKNGGGAKEGPGSQTIAQIAPCNMNGGSSSTAYSSMAPPGQMGGIDCRQQSSFNSSANGARGLPYGVPPSNMVGSAQSNATTTRNDGTDLWKSTLTGQPMAHPHLPSGSGRQYHWNDATSASAGGHSTVNHQPQDPSDYGQWGSGGVGVPPSADDGKGGFYGNHHTGRILSGGSVGNVPANGWSSGGGGGGGSYGAAGPSSSTNASAVGNNRLHPHMFANHPPPPNRPPPPVVMSHAAAAAGSWAQSSPLSGPPPPPPHAAQAQHSGWPNIPPPLLPNSASGQNINGQGHVDMMCNGQNPSSSASSNSSSSMELNGLTMWKDGAHNQNVMRGVVNGHSRQSLMNNGIVSDHSGGAWGSGVEHHHLPQHLPQHHPHHHQQQQQHHHQQQHHQQQHHHNSHHLQSQPQVPQTSWDMMNSGGGGGVVVDGPGNVGAASIGPHGSNGWGAKPMGGAGGGGGNSSSSLSKNPALNNWQNSSASPADGGVNAMDGGLNGNAAAIHKMAASTSLASSAGWSNSGGARWAASSKQTIQPSEHDHLSAASSDFGNGLSNGGNELHTSSWSTDSSSALWKSKQFRILNDMGCFKRTDIEMALRTNNMCLEDAIELLNRKTAASAAAASSIAPTTMMDSSSLSPAMSRRVSSADEGRNFNNINISESQLNSQMPNGTSNDGEKLQYLASQIKMAVNAGYLNDAILTQPMASSTLVLLNELLHGIQALQTYQEQHASLARNTSPSTPALLDLTVRITQTKNLISNLKNQISAQQAIYLKSIQKSGGMAGNGVQSSGLFPKLPASSSSSQQQFGQNNACSSYFASASANGREIPGSRVTSSQTVDSSNIIHNMLQSLDLVDSASEDQKQANVNVVSSVPSSEAVGSVVCPSVSVAQSGSRLHMWKEGAATVATTTSAANNLAESNNGIDPVVTSNQQWLTSLTTSSSVTETTVGVGQTDTFASIPEFQPGKPWKSVGGIRNPEQDPTLTPGSAFAFSSVVPTTRAAPDMADPATSSCDK